MKNDEEEFNKDNISYEKLVIPRLKAFIEICPSSFE